MTDETTQADRDAAGAYLVAMAKWRKACGNKDIPDLAKAFAKHRLAHSLPSQADATSGEEMRLREAIAKFLPKNIDLDNANIEDDLILPMDVTVGELRALAALAKGTE